MRTLLVLLAASWGVAGIAAACGGGGSVPEDAARGRDGGDFDASGDAARPDGGGGNADGDAASPDGGSGDAGSLDAGGDALRSDGGGDAAPALDGGGDAGVATGAIVPLYSEPPNADWTALAQAQVAHPDVPITAIINPESGPGAARSTAYVNGIAALKLGGCRVIGYVATTYAAKATADVEAEIDRYASWYPALDGIFFDEMSNTTGDEGYYAGLTTYVRGKGMTLTVGNPGTAVPTSFLGTVDVIFIYEDPGLPSLGSLASWKPHRTAVGIIPYGVSALDTTFVAGAKQDVGSIYITDDSGANPWDQLATYFDALVAALAP